MLGEETLWKYPHIDLNAANWANTLQLYPELKDTLPPEPNIVALLDMVDGTDLVERDLSNWCSAIVFFDPRVPEILFSLVQDSRKRIYFASEHGGAKIMHNGNPKPLATPQKVKACDASICFYAQKYKNFVSIPQGFIDWLKKTCGGIKQPALRLYTLAGNPMMVRVANGENIHAVFEHYGQCPHDVVPGAYIALRAKAYLFGLDRQKITETYLAKKLLTPSKGDIKYVLASTRKLALQLVDCFRASKSPESTQIK